MTRKQTVNRGLEQLTEEVEMVVVQLPPQQGAQYIQGLRETAQIQARPYLTNNSQQPTNPTTQVGEAYWLLSSAYSEEETLNTLRILRDHIGLNGLEFEVVSIKNLPKDKIFRKEMKENEREHSKAMAIKARKPGATNLTVGNYLYKLRDIVVEDYDLAETLVRDEDESFATFEPEKGDSILVEVGGKYRSPKTAERLEELKKIKL